MTPVPEVLPTDEDERLAAVRRYDVLDTPPDGAFDRVTALAARFCGVPVSTITIVDHDRIWFKSAHGIDVDEVDRDPGLCASVVMNDAPYVVTNAAVDPRTLQNPLVLGELGLRFYVGIPLRTSEGHNLGTLNIIDVEPREVTDEELEVLDDLAAIVVDELELRLAAKERVEAQAVSEAARFRDAILAGVSHEMRTPMAVLRGVVDLLGSDDEEPEAVRPTMRRQLARLDWLVSQFLDFASIQDDQVPSVRLRVIDLTAVVEEASDVFAGQAEITVASEGSRSRAVADPERVRQVLMELIDNAATLGSSPPVRVEIEGGEDGNVAAAVRFTAPGIDRASLERLFEPSGAARGTAGTGIGMFVGRRLAEAQGGRLDVEASDDHERGFVLVLPAAQDSA